MKCADNSKQEKSKQERWLSCWMTSVGRLADIMKWDLTWILQDNLPREKSAAAEI